MKSEALVSPEVLKVFETVPDLYLVLSPELEVLTASDAFLRASRSEREEWVGKNLFDGSLPGNWAQEVFTQISVRDAFLKVISSKEAFQKPLHFHGEFPCTNGTAEPSDKFLRLHFTPGFNNQEKLQYLLVKVEDQTEFTLCQEKVEAQNLDTAQLREAQQALQQNQQLLQATLDSSMDMIQVFEAVRGANGEIIDFNWVLNNNTSEKWYGNVIGKSLLQLNPGVREVGIFDTFKQVVETGQADVSERHYVYEQFEGWYQQSTVKLNDGVATTTTDISALKKAEQELRQSKHLLQDIINAPHIGIAVYKAIRNEKGEVTDFVHEYMNRASIAMLGGEDFTGRLFSTHGENALEQMQALTEALQTGRGNKYTREANLNGRTFWFAITNTPLDADRLVHTWEDVTERKNAEEELRKAKELVQTVFDVSLNPIAYHKAIRDQNGNIVDFEFVVENQQARKYAQQDRRGQKYSEAYPGIRETEIFRLYTQVVETGHTLNKEVQLPVKGIDRWFHIMGVKLGDGLVATALDITENKNAVEEILRLKDEIAQHTEDKYKALFDSIDDGFVILEMIPDESGKWVDFIYRENNLSFIKHVGVDLRGKRRSELFLDKKDFLLEKYEHLIKTGESLHFEYSVDALNKQSFQATASRIGKEGSRLIGVVFRNITERKQRELQQEYLLKLSDLMQRLTEPNELKTAAMQLLGQHLGVSRAQYHECDSSGEYYSADGIGYADGLPLLDLKYRIDDFGTFVAEDFEAGRPFRIGDLWEDPRPTAAEQEAYRAYQIRAGAGIPLLHGGKLVAVLAVHDQHPHPWTDLEMELIRETAERVWLAVERLRAEEALRKSEEKYRTLFESIDEGYCLIEVIYNGKGEPNDIRFLEVNTAFENNTGVANITGKLASEVAPNEDYWLKAYHNVLKTATPLRIEDYNAASNRWYSVYAASVSQASPLLNIVFNDITERKQREQNQAFLVEMTDSLQRLTQPEEITQAIGLRVGEYLNLSSCLFVDVDDARNEVTVHYGWEKDGAPTLKKQTFLLSDYLTEEFARACRTGETVIICDTGNDPRTDAEAYARLKVGAYVVVPFHRDGRWVAHLVLLSETSRDWKEDEIELGKNIADRVFPRIERARAEEALRKSEEKFRTLFESIDEGFCLQELILDEQDQVVDLIYREVNDAFARHTGLTNAIGQKASELMPNLEQNWLDAMTHVYRTGEPLHTEGYQAHLDRWFTMQCTRVGRTGSPWVAGVFNDIT
ncbi:MAG: GAF domain-containing protein, partial [Rufibacter sp.]